MISLGDEDWRDIPGFKGIYVASNLGQIGRVTSNRPTVKTPTPNVKSGYLYVHLWRGNRYYSRTVHSLVALAFHGSCPDGMEVSHLDGNKHNCRADNLKYETRPENHARKGEHGTALVGERNHKAKLTEEDVRQIRADVDDGRPYPSLAREYGVSPGAIGLVARRKTWRHVA